MITDGSGQTGHFLTQRNINETSFHLIGPVPPAWYHPRGGAWTPLAGTGGAAHISCSNSAGGGPAQALKVAEVVSGLENTRPRRGEAKWSTWDSLGLYTQTHKHTNKQTHTHTDIYIYMYIYIYIQLFGAAFLVVINHPTLGQSPKLDPNNPALGEINSFNCQGYPPAPKTRHTMGGSSTANQITNQIWYIFIYIYIYISISLYIYISLSLSIYIYTYT